MQNSTFSNRDIDAIKAIVERYFAAIHHGDVNELRQIFHAETELKAPGLRRDMHTWLTHVEQRGTPAANNAPYDYRILAIDVVNDQAMVKLVCPLFEHVYIDFLGLLKEDSDWLIVNKMYTHI